MSALVFCASLAAALLGAGGSAEAQEVLVSSYTSATTSDVQLNNAPAEDGLQLFTTGTNAAGYTLTSITFEFYPSSQPSPVPTVKLHNVTVAGATVTLGTAVATLTTSATTILYTPEETYTAPMDTALDPSTTYGILAEGGVGGNALWGIVPTGTVEGTPAVGWSIGDYMATRAHDATGNFTVGSLGTGKIRITGEVKTSGGGGGGGGGGGDGGGGDGGGGDGGGGDGGGGDGGGDGGGGDGGGGDDPTPVPALPLLGQLLLGLGLLGAGARVTSRRR